MTERAADTQGENQFKGQNNETFKENKDFKKKHTGLQRPTEKEIPEQMDKEFKFILKRDFFYKR